MKKQTPVEWLALRYHHRQGYLSQDDIAEAKEMEKQYLSPFVTMSILHELWQKEKYGNYYKEDETQHDAELD
jgi:hypothetical protein